MNKKTIIIIVILSILAVLFIAYTFSHESQFNEIYEKPVIYLYPKQIMEVSVKINYEGKLMYTYPKYNEGWKVTAHPDGTLYQDNKEYSYLFWEGTSNKEWNINKGFVVKGEDTVNFLQEKLAYMGLTPKEYNEFIVYWYPKMHKNKYNLIYFAGEEYTSKAELEITPNPDSVLRIFMVYKPLKRYINIEEQKLESFKRKGFTVIEWGGTEIK